jgi:7,8-dihydroneopterin aldolase/epimerase/oxygenase
MTDLVYIRGLRAEALIGVHPWERALRQALVFDLELAADAAAAAASDALADALDYEAVARRVRELCAASSCQLLETLAETVADALVQEFAVPWLRLRLEKPGAVPETSGVGVMIERGRRRAQ